MATIPQSSIHTTGRKIGHLLFRLLAKRREIAIDNIRQALPFMKRHPAWSSRLETSEKIAHETFMRLGMSIVEICRLYHGKEDAIINTIEVRGREHFDQARKKHLGLICVGGHCGNWELMAATLRLNDCPGVTVGRRIYFHKYDKFLNELRMEKRRSGTH